MFKYKYIAIVAVCVFIAQCKSPLKKVEDIKSLRTIDFGKIVKIKTSEIISNFTFIHLETTENSLIGNINQIEIYNDNIYILDKNITNSLYIFSNCGKFLNKIKNQGNGPGEFISPSSFYIDKRGFLLIYDMQLGRLLKYDLKSLRFIEEIKMPFYGSKSVFVLSYDNLFLYYGNNGKDGNEKCDMLNIVDEMGNVHRTFLKAKPIDRMMHGNQNNFYEFSGKIYFYPHFSNKIYAVSKDSINCAYELFFGDNKMVDIDLYSKSGNSIDFFKKVLMGNEDWIRLLYVYENDSNLIVKYYIKKDLFMGIYEKISGKVVNFKYSDVTDDSGIGGKLPLPIGVYGDQFIAQIDFSDIDKADLRNDRLKKIIDVSSENTNPILMIYSINGKVGMKQ